MNNKKVLNELEERARDIAVKKINDVLRQLNNFEYLAVRGKLQLLLNDVFQNYMDYAYFNFGQPIYASLLVNPKGVFVKILPVKDKHHFKEVYGLSVDEALELIKYGKIVPVLDEKVEFFSESDEEILYLLEKSVSSGLVLNYYYEEFARRFLNEVYKEVNDLFNNLKQHCDVKIYRLVEEWSKKLGVKRTIAFDELIYNAYITYLQYKIINLEKSKIIKSILERDPYDAIQFMFYSSTFDTDPLFYSPSGNVIAGFDDITYSIQYLSAYKLTNELNELIDNFGSFVYKGLVLEVGASLLGHNHCITIKKDFRRISDLVDQLKGKIDKEIHKEKQKIVRYIITSLNQNTININELFDEISLFKKNIKELYEQLSDPPNQVRRKCLITIAGMGLATMIIYYALTNISIDFNNIAAYLPGFIGSIGVIKDIYDGSFVLRKLIDYMSRLKRTKKEQKPFKINDMPMVSVVDVHYR